MKTKRIISLLLCMLLLTGLMSNVMAEQTGDFKPLTGDATVRFLLMSDTHIKDYDCPEEQRFSKAIQTAYKLDADLDAVVIAGDISDFGTLKQYEKINKLLDDNVKDSTERVLAIGNHDFEGGISRFEEQLNTTVNSDTVINGIHFITVGLSAYGSYAANIEWLEQTLEDANDEDSKKPIFVAFHYPVSNTVTGSEHWGLEDLNETLKKYPQVIQMAGHTHYALNDPRAIYQKDYTSLATATISYFEMDDDEIINGPYPVNSSEAAQVMVVEVDKKNTVTIRKLDLNTDTYIGEPWVIKNPSDKSAFTYTDERKNNSKQPEFSKDAAIAINNVSRRSVEFTFNQAISDKNSMTYSYKITIKNLTDTSAKDIEYKIWSDYYYNPMPQALTQKVTNLTANSEYEITLTAYDAFGLESKNTLTKKFKTTLGGYDFSVLAPVADVLDVDFADGEIKDKSPSKLDVSVFGSVDVTKNDDVNGYIASFDGSFSNYIKIPMNTNIYNKILKNVTLETTVMFNSFDNIEQCPFSNMQSGGLGFDATRTGDGKAMLEAWAYINYEYVHTGVEIDAGKVYHATATYDGKELALFINGELKASIVAEGEIALPDTSECYYFAIGGDSGRGGADYVMNGFVSSARIYSRALSEDEVFMIYSREFAHKDTTGPSFKLDTAPVYTANIGDTVKISDAQVYDNNDGKIDEYTVSVTGPNGFTADDDFAVETVGEYVVTYSAKDTKGNEGTFAYSIMVSDGSDKVDADSPISIWIYVTAALALLVVIAAVTFILVKKSKNNK